MTAAIIALIALLFIGPKTWISLLNVILWWNVCNPVAIIIIVIWAFNKLF